MALNVSSVRTNLPTFGKRFSIRSDRHQTCRPAPDGGEWHSDSAWFLPILTWLSTFLQYVPIFLHLVKGFLSDLIDIRHAAPRQTAENGIAIQPGFFQF